MNDKIKNMTFRALKRHQPHLLMVELECTRYNLFNKNMNYAHRLDEWQMRQQEHQPLLDLGVGSALIQYRAGRFFLLENPLRSEVWSKPRVEELRHLPGVWEVVVDLGAFGATNNDGEPIQKPVMFVGNMPVWTWCYINDFLKMKKPFASQFKANTPETPRYTQNDFAEPS